MANPRKFSEKIALQKQKQDECSAEFDKIMKEVCSIGGNHSNHSHNNASVSSSGGGGGSGSGSGASGGGASPEGNTGGGGSSPTTYRESRGRSVGVGPIRRPSDRKQDRSPYGSNSNSANISVNNGQNVAYLIPPDNNWRRSNSDSALHQSLNIAVAAENPYLTGEMHALQTNYQHRGGQRSPSPHTMSRHLSPQAQRRKGSSIMQQQQHLMAQHQNHHTHQQQQQHHIQMPQQQQMHLHQQQVNRQQQQSNAVHQHAQHSHQTQQTYNPKFINCNIPANSLFKSLQEQQLNFANTGSLPDLTSVHFASPAQQIQQQQQQNLASALSPNNNAHSERDQSPSPFSPVTGPASPYHQQQNSPTASASVAQTNSPHMSFKIISTAGTNQQAQASSSGAQQSNVNYNPLPTLGANNATSNLTDYRQPLNPPSPGSSPGLLTSPTGNDLQNSAPASPIRSTPTGSLSQQQNMHGFDRYSPSISGGGGGGSSNLDGGYNTLNPSFHNHFEQFSLGDSNSSPEQMQHQFQSAADSNFSLDFEDFTTSANGGNNPQSSFPHDYNDFQGETTGGGNNSATTANSNNNNNGNSVQQILLNQQQQQQLSNNNAGHSNHITSIHQQPTNNNPNLSPVSESGSNSTLRQDIRQSNSPIPNSSPSSPLPIPISPQSPHQQQLNLALHSQSVQHSPHHSPMHSPHHTSSISAPTSGVTALGGQVSSSANCVSSNHATPLNGGNNIHHHHQQQGQMGNTPTTNIPAIIFSDYSSNADYTREIFDSLDLDLGQIDVAGLQMLSDPNGIMIADPNIEDSFRRDLN